MPTRETHLYRDAFGVPHLRAGSELELAYAQGRVTALDRSWQIETDRWRAENRLAAFVGESGFAWDEFAVRSRLADTARRAYDALAADDRAWVDAYVEGVNAGLDAGRAASPEFAVLADLPGTCPAHEPWPAWMPLGIFFVAHTLFSTFPNVLWRAHVLEQAGPDWLAVLEGVPPLTAGSNAWGLTGRRTSDGAPIIAGDPHRPLELPGVYQQVRLACPEYDVVGLAFPGVPGVQHFGHSGAAAWGITNAVAHSTRVYREHLTSRSGVVTAAGGAGDEPVDETSTDVEVRGGGSVRVRSIETRRGTVVVDGPATFSIRQVPRVTSDLGFAAFRPLLRARSAADVFAAMDRWVDPVNRVVAADADGVVLRGTVGLCPRVGRADRWLPRDAREDHADAWVERSAPAPVRDWVVDANERPVDRPAHDLGDSYPSARRAERIQALVSPLSDATPARLATIHGDATSTTARLLVLRLVEASAGATLTAAASALLDELSGWSGHMGEASRTAGAFAAWRVALVGRLLEHPVLRRLGLPHGMGGLLDPWFEPWSRVSGSLERVLAADDLGVDAEAVLVDALESVAAGPRRTWGEQHVLVPLHVLGASAPAAVRDSFSVGLRGDVDTVFSTAPSLGGHVFIGPVARWIWDLGDRQRSRWNVPFGASGVVGDPHFDDQFAAWRAAETIPVVTDWSLLQETPWG